MDGTPPPAGIWKGEPSGQFFAALLRERARQIGVQVAVEVVPSEAVGRYIVDIDWDASRMTASSAK